MMPNSSNLANDSPKIDQASRGDRNLVLGEMSGGTAIGNVEGEVNFYIYSSEGKPQFEVTPKSSVRAIPPLLPYLPNRKQQEEQLATAIQNYLNKGTLKPLVCVIHGDENQSHDQFLERLKKCTFPKYMGLDSKQSRIEDCVLTWPNDVKNLDNLELESRFFKDLAEHFIRDNSATRRATGEEINQSFCKYPVPIIIRTHLLTMDWQQQGSIILDKLLQFWQSWPNLTPEQKLIVCLSIKYQVRYGDNINQSKVEWLKNYFTQKSWQKINKQIRGQLESLSSDNFKQFDRISGIVLPELTEINRSQVENWARNEAKEFVGDEMCGKLVEEVGTIFQSTSTIPMCDLADKLTDLLKKLAVNNRGGL
jgi:hypothetical protein